LIDITRFVTPLDGDPSGPNLEYDPDFLALERAQLGRGEQVIGDAVKPAEDPDWRAVIELGEALMGRTRDLRVAVAWTTASLKTEGLTGLASGLGLIKGLLESQWDTVHPQLDADDDNDPTLRINSLLSLAATDGALKALRESPIVQSKTLGRFSLRDVRIASGKIPAPAALAEPPKSIQIDAAFRDADLESLIATAAAAADALAGVGDIDRLLTDKVGGSAPDLKPLVRDLTEIKQVLAEKLAARGVGTASPTGGTGADGLATPGGAATGEIGSREDVIIQLDRLCEYYRRHEPSSPVPMLLRRAKRLVSKDFMEIIRDLTPGGVAEAEVLSGAEKLPE
jgi:type VI secretion system protein ImpA